jgi:hypothetical protein
MADVPLPYRKAAGLAIFQAANADTSGGFPARSFEKMPVPTEQTFIVSSIQPSIQGGFVAILVGSDFTICAISALTAGCGVVFSLQAARCSAPFPRYNGKL